MTPGPAIEAIDLVKQFGDPASQDPAVDGVSFAVPQGTCYASALAVCPSLFGFARRGGRRAFPALWLP